MSGHPEASRDASGHPEKDISGGQAARPPYPWEVHLVILQLLFVDKLVYCLNKSLQSLLQQMLF
jgi:hypothetical protein